MLGYIFSWICMLVCWVPFLNILCILLTAPFAVLGHRLQKDAKRVYLMVGTVVLAVALIVSVVVTTVETKDQIAKWRQGELFRVYETYCQDDACYAVLSRDGSLLILDSNPENQAGQENQATLQAMAAVNRHLQLPQEITQAMLEQTTETHTHQRKNLLVSWTHDSDCGLEVMYRLELPAK